MEKSINKHISIDLSHLQDESLGTVIDALIKEAQNHEWSNDEVTVLTKEALFDGSDEHFWKVICLYTNTLLKDIRKIKRYVRYGISDITFGSEEEPSKYAQVFDVNGKFLGEAEVYIIGYEVYEDE